VWYPKGHYRVELTSWDLEEVIFDYKEPFDEDEAMTNLNKEDPEDRDKDPKYEDKDRADK